MVILISSRQQNLAGQRYLQMLQSVLRDFYSGNVQVTSVDVRQNGVAAGVFVGDRQPFSFTLTDAGITFQPLQRQDNYDTAHDEALIPVEVGGTSAYRAGYLAALRQDATGKGYKCGDGWISRTKECRIGLRSPSQQKKLQSLIDVGKIIHKAGGSSILAPLLAIAGAGFLGFAIGNTLGQYQGAQNAATPARERPVRQATPKKRSPVAEEIPDPWLDPEEQPVASTAKPEKKRGKKQEPKISVVSPQNADGTYNMSPDDVRLAPDIFQYKLPNEISSRATQQYKESGTTGALDDTNTWNPQVAGAIKVWRVPQGFKLNGRTYNEGEVLVVHGHHRLALAKRAEAIANPDPTQPPIPGKPESIKVEFVQAGDWKQARVLGAMENIALGAGTSKDAANIFRELGINSTEQLKQQGLSLKNRVAEEGAGLAGLSDRLWKKVTDPTNTEMSLRRASYIGQVRDPDLQEEVWKQVKETRGATDEYVKALSRQVQHQLETGQVQRRSNSGDQGALFDLSVTVANLKERAEVDAFVERAIASEAVFWQRAAKPARMQQILQQEQAGQIDIDRAGKVSDQTAIARFLYQKGKYVSADPNYQKINDALIQSGNELRDLRESGATKREVDAFKRRIYARIRDLLAQGLNDG